MKKSYFILLLVLCAPLFFISWKTKRPTTLSMVDPLATKETKALYANLWLLQQKGTMFGHHDYLSYGINADGTNWKGDQIERSDVKSLVGDHPAVYSLDMRVIDQSKIKLIKAVHKRGGVIMIAWHQYHPLTGPPTPEKQNGPGSAWDTTKVVDKILTDGSAMNIKYKKILDSVANVFHSLKDEKGNLIPVIFRPLHEHTQGWSWWGNKATTEKEYISFWRFMVHYLRDTKKVRNVIYAISPGMNGIYPDAKSRLLYAWPGNNYVDFIGMDCYHGLNTANFVSNISALHQLSGELKKPVGVTEVGIDKNHPKEYWTKNILDELKNVRMSMVVAWRNAATHHGYGPYPGDSSAADFVKFYQDPFTFFEKDLPKMYSMPKEIIIK